VFKKALKEIACEAVPLADPIEVNIARGLAHQSALGRRLFRQLERRNATGDNREVRMASMTCYVALAFTRSEGGDIVACEPKEARISGHWLVAEGNRPCLG